MISISSALDIHEQKRVTTLLAAFAQAWAASWRHSSGNTRDPQFSTLTCTNCATQPLVTCCETDLVNLSLVVAVLLSILYGLSRTPLQAAAAFGAIDIAAQLHGSGGACFARGEMASRKP